MEPLGSVSSIIAVVQIAGSVAKLCGGYIADVKDARKDIERLQQKAATLRDVLERIAEADNGTNSKPQNLSDSVLESINRCSQDLGKLQETLQPKTRHKTMSRVGLRALKWPLTKSSVNEEVRMIEGYLTVFNGALQLSHITISKDIDRKIDQGRDDQLLKSISHIGDAAFDSYENQRHRPCLTDTRVDLLQEITDWATCDSSQYIFWLQGRAGTGKSTIALTIAQSLDKQGASLASFFFKRGAGDLARSRKVISSIVFQLAIRSRYFGSLVCDALREYPSLGDSASLPQQYDKLLLRPLQRARQNLPQSLSFVAVLDALDECDDFDDIRLLLRMLGDTQNMAGLGLRVLLTSRPEIPIRLGFYNMKHIAYHELALHDVPRTIVDEDIKRFVTHELAQIKVERQLPHFWPGDDKIRIITTRADGLFIYAATVCIYVNGPWQVSPLKRLEQVCFGDEANHKSTEALDRMYSTVLASSMTGDFSPEEEERSLLRLRQVVGSVVLLFDNLSAMELTRLLFRTAPTGENDVQRTLGSLHAVLDVPESPNKPIRMLHLSFRDFLVDSTRCRDVRFQMNQHQVHHDLFDNCLDLMKQALRKNICQLSGPGCFVDEVSEAALSQHLPLGLRYACRHWIIHAEHGRVDLSDGGPVHKFLRQFCPYWLEVMGLIRKIPEATTLIIQLKNLIEAKKSPELHDLIQDVFRFILTFNHVLANAPMQLYNTALIFSPIRNVFRRSFNSPADLRVRTQILPEWNACIQTLEGHSGWVTGVVFSLDGTQIASGSDDETVRVWDVQTGQCSTLEGHSDGVNTVVFSPDGTQIASGSDDETVRVWDVQTGQCSALEGHSGGVNTVVFSPDGSKIASGSDDKTVRVWDVQTRQCSTLKGHSDWIMSVVFSPDGSQVASGSFDKTVRVWDVQTGQCSTLEGHSDGVYAVVPSPDGSKIASSSYDKTVRVWDVQTRQCSAFEGHSDGVNTVVFSPDGTQIASGSFDKTVRVWDVQTGQYRWKLKGHSNWINAVVFSPDGSQVASGSDDKTIQVWDVQTSQCQYKFEGHLDRVISVVFSPDGSRIASGSYDGTVRVWDVQTGQYRYTLEGHSNWVNIVVFSPDGSQVASGSDDKTVRVWDVQTGKVRYTLEGHLYAVEIVVFSPDGSRIASGSRDETVRVWDVQNGQCQHTFEGHSDAVNTVVFSPDGSQIASASHDMTVRVWDVQTGQCLYTLEGHSGWVNSVLFSLDGSRVASASGDETVRVWDVQAAECQYTLEGHLGEVTSVAFSLDGSRIASASEDETVRVWDIASSTEILCYEAGIPNHDIEFSDDGSKIFVDGTSLSLPPPTSLLPTAVGSRKPHSNKPVSKLEIRDGWVTLSDKRVLWLPPEYRPGDWARHGDTIVIGSGTGRVTFVYCGATNPSLS